MLLKQKRQEKELEDLRKRKARRGTANQVKEQKQTETQKRTETLLKEKEICEI
jgi:hypothetical protein